MMNQELFDLLVKEQQEQDALTERDLADVKARLQRVEEALAYYDLRHPVTAQWDAQVFDANAAEVAHA